MSTIKVIAPLSPAGEFPIADANNISLGSGGNTPKSGSVAAAVSELQQELGITAGVEGSVSAKLDYVKDNLDSKTSTTEITDTINEALTELKSLLGNTTDNPSLFTALKDLADDLNTLQEYIGRDTTEGLTKVLDTIYTRTGTLVECLGDTDEGIIGYINAMVSSIDSLLTKFESSIGSTNANFSSLTENLLNKFGSFESAVNESLDSLTNTVSDIVEDNEGVLLAALGVSGDENVKGLIDNLTGKVDTLTDSVGTDVSSAVGTINANLGTYDEGKNVKTTIEDESNSIKEALSDLRSHMNTMLPPTLDVEHSGGDSVYQYNLALDLTITAKVNRPLEDPLALYINGTPIEYDEHYGFNGSTYRASWQVTCPDKTALPYKAQATVQIVNKNDSRLVYNEKVVNCTFGAMIYTWVGTKNNIIPGTGSQTQNKLSAGHPGNISFICTDQYCYYACPVSYGEPTFSVGGQVGGFTRLTETQMIGELSYNIYRSNQAQLNSVTVNIK